ncbi:uncharacterized protein LOC135168140 isoform X2 [Diachasmimorpha longicaudata]|uniref:uncharacterized protein LOC135168140 isoform X2 n=1 Tax=Diachasmimorpha longicaudata TaxID=58733 RepID=UPI0030B90388
MDNEEIDAVACLGEFSLENAYDHLTDVQKDLHSVVEQLMNVASNNDIGILTSSVTPEIIQSKQCQFFESLIKHMNNLDIRAEPINGTSDLYEQTIQELENGVRKMKVLETTVKEEINDVRKEVIRLENENKGLQWMKDACIGAIADVGNSTYDKEIALASRLFAQVKEDLGQLVAVTTVSNEDFQEVLAELTSCHMKGEADVAAYHRNDKSKVRLIDLI